MKLTGTRQSLGTLEYGAPEQFTDAKHVDHRCDLYSFAASFYTALTGMFPFGSADTGRFCNGNVSTSLYRCGCGAHARSSRGSPGQSLPEFRPSQAPRQLRGDSQVMRDYRSVPMPDVPTCRYGSIGGFQVVIAARVTLDDRCCCQLIFRSITSNAAPVTRKFWMYPQKDCDCGRLRW